MKKCISIMLAVFLLITCLLTGVSATDPLASATRKTETRTIGIVFDNSGSMYIGGNLAWNQATYAMEVFAAMLNKGDTLLIYPMHPIKVDNKEYTMDDPLRITDASQSATIRNIYTPNPQGTPIETIDSAAQGLAKQTGDKKYLIILSDGAEFYENDINLGKGSRASKKALDDRVNKYAGKDMSVMYLGIGGDVVTSGVPESEYFTQKKVVNSKDVLSTLTEMCNQIFGRDSLDKKYISKGKSVELQLSMKKLIVFVQGENVTDLQVTGPNGPVGQLLSTASTKYSDINQGQERSDFKGITFPPDTSLQGMLVTYTDCTAGKYDISYSGKETSIEVYYEPDADLAFVFTDSEGNIVDPNSLYEGDYKVSFGMKDAKTGKLIDSDQLGQPQYKGSYFFNGKEYPFTHEGFSGEVDVHLEMDDTFEANLTVTYLSGYTITKDSTEFGWPEGGIKVAPRPAGDFKLEISGGQELYSLQNLEEGKPYIAKVYYQGEQMTGEELEKVDIKWQPETSNAEITQEFADDHYKLTLHYKDPSDPPSTVCGECTVSIHAFYTPQGSNETETSTSLTYNIEDDFSPLKIELYAPQDYIVIKDLEGSEPIVVKMLLNGKPLTAEEFGRVSLQIDCSGLQHTDTPVPQESCYTIKLMPSAGVNPGDYPVKVTATFTDQIGRESQVSDALSITLSNMPLWVKWAIGLGILLLIILIIWWITHLRVLPKHAHEQLNDCYMSVEGMNVTSATTFRAKLSGKTLEIRVDYAGNRVGVMMDVEPGKESYLYKKQHRRTISVKPTTVRKSGEVSRVDIGGISYKLDANEKLVPDDENQKKFLLSNGAEITIKGKVDDGGRTKSCFAKVPLNYKKRR